MTILDWAIIFIYMFLVVGMAALIGRRQKNQEDYYLAGRTLNPWFVGFSLMANQVSAISLIGAPAFIVLQQSGGLKWLQYEMAVPLAMILIAVFLVPVFWRLKGLTIYEYLEQRFGRATRSLLSLVFLVSRSLGTGVALLAASYVTSVCLGINLTITVVLIGAISLIYTALGGIKADIYSDVIQLGILWLSSFVCIWILIELNSSIEFPVSAMQRLYIFDFRSTGWGDGNTFSFWPMLLGGFFLYISYYGCDQSQAQRLMCTQDRGKAQKALLVNGVFRFLLVLTYCMVGVLLIPFLLKYPEFARSLKNLPPDYLMPMFFKEFIPSGLLGMVMAGILAASMSSLDSAINSLSAVTWEDFLCRVFPGLKRMGDRGKVRSSRLITVGWGTLVVVFALMLAGGAETVIELVNKIGSAFYGPIAGVFFLGMISRRVKQLQAVSGLAAGVIVNLGLWLFFSPAVSWMWWNLTGFAATFFTGIIFMGKPGKIPAIEVRIKWPRSVWILVLWFMFILAVCLVLQGVFLGL